MTEPPSARTAVNVDPARPCPRLWTIPEAAALLNVPENWLRKKVAAQAVPCTRLGKHVRFTDEHLDQIVEAGEQRPIPVVTPGQGLSSRARRAS